MAKRKKKSTAETEPAPIDAVASVDVTPAETPAASPSEPLTAKSMPIAPGASRAPRRLEFPEYADPDKPFSLAHHNVAGVRLLKFDRFKQVQLAFQTPPSELADELLVQNGWRWREEENVYTKQYGDTGEPRALIEAKRLYNDLVDERLAELGKQQARRR